MSLGIGGVAKFALEDEYTVIYQYYAYNFNDMKHANSEKIYDGMITIKKNCIPSPEIHQKLKRQPSGKKKLITKRIPQDVDLYELIENGQIIVENSKHCSRKHSNGVGGMAMRLIKKIIKEYQIEGKFPEIVGCHI